MSTSPRSETLTLDQVKPYWRNPRKITDEAVQAVQASLDEFGYVQPIVVDEDDVIIIGHTRYTAMRRLGVEKVEVLKVSGLPASKVKQLRIVDNRTHELSIWDADKLWDELDAIGDRSGVMADVFPEAELPEGTGARPLADFESVEASNEPTEVEFICPSCFHEFEIPVTREQIFSGSLKVEEV